MIKIRFQKARCFEDFTKNFMLFALLVFSWNLFSENTFQAKDLPEDFFGNWYYQENHLAFVATPDYVIMDNEIWSYFLVLNGRLSVDIYLTNNKEERLIQFSEVNGQFLQIKIDQAEYLINKSSNSLNIPKYLIAIWRNADLKLEINQKQIIVSDSIKYKVDKIVKVNSGFLIAAQEKDNYLLFEVLPNDDNWIIKSDTLSETPFYKSRATEKWLKYVIYVLVSILFILLIFRWRMIVQRKKDVIKHKLADMQLKSIRSQMNPHFLFNALSAIQHLINKGDSDKANHYLTEFSQLMRLTLDKSESGLVPLSDEITSIKKYLELENLRFSFTYDLKTDSLLNTFEIEIPAMLFQPFVENAIIHGLNGSGDNKKLDIEFIKKSDYLQCFIKDNGIGIKSSKSKKKSLVKKTHYGHKLAEDRIQLINESHNTNAKIVITDLSDISKTETGTLIEILTPLNY